ncbi:hypothetical protein [Streptomyces sp. Ac-502]|uniref:hypothetical protein n=1 Tax=Streptomyces sp. Ac-502 TaxID=3342801 RepID=UPI00386277F1
MRVLTGRSPEEEFWTPDRQLLATIADRVAEGTYAQVRLHGDPKRTRRLKPPDPIPRPGVTARKPRNTIRFGGRHGSGAQQLASVFGGAPT